MGRPESRLSGNDPRLLAFANDLRRLRRDAGSPSYRKLAKQAHSGFLSKHELEARLPGSTVWAR